MIAARSYIIAYASGVAIHATTAIANPPDTPLLRKSLITKRKRRGGRGGKRSMNHDAPTIPTIDFRAISREGSRDHAG